jgi:hypothetical protein
MSFTAVDYDRDPRGWRQNDQETYDRMRAGGRPVEPELLARIVAACQQNPWLKVGGVDFEDDPCAERDYQVVAQEYEDLELLRLFFQHGNWAIRQGVRYRDLIFLNQVNGGDEWWTLKVDGDRLVPFESMSWRRIIQGGRFEETMRRLLDATVEQCRALEY